MEEDEVVHRGYRITGRVQGVFFRVWTRDTAVSMGVRGTVRNLPDGSVQAQLAAPGTVVEEMVARLWEGPPGARVDGVEEIGVEAFSGTDSFQIIY